VLTVRLEVLVSVVIAIWVIVSMLWSERVHLLRTCSVLVRAGISTHGHYIVVSY
jgi:hypothetical protein